MDGCESGAKEYLLYSYLTLLIGTWMSIIETKDFTLHLHGTF